MILQPTDERLWLWLVRHGESRWNVQRRVQGHADDSGLTLRGRRQAIRLAVDARSDSWLPPSIAVISVAPSRRPSLWPAGWASTSSSDVRLRERSYGVLEGLPTTELSPACWGIEGGRVVGRRCPSGWVASL